jgi:hypothetical protein
MKKLPVSFEFFPPKTPEGAEKLRAVRQQLYTQAPEFCSVTYGAGGSTQEGTFGTVGEILKEGVAAASHFSCIGASEESVRKELATLKAMGVKRLVAMAWAARFITRPIWWLSFAKKPATTFTLKWRLILKFIRRPSPLSPICRPLWPR